MIIAKVYIKPGSESDFISAASLIIESSNKEEGCLGYMLYRIRMKIADMTSSPAELKILDIAGEK